MLAKKFALGFGIAIILPMLIHYGVSTITPMPKWEDRYSSNYYQDYQNATPEAKIEMKKQEEQKAQVLREKQRIFQRNLFFVAVPVGIFSILFGSVVAIQSVGTGFMFGGIFCLIQGYSFYWSELQDWMRFVSLLLAFVVLIFVGYRKLEK